MTSEEFCTNFQHKVLDYITTEKIDDRMKVDICGDNPRYKEGFIQGMLWSAMLMNYYLTTGKFPNEE